ncbi:MAG: 50S ribosomal protein L32e [Nitrososphaeria archaeon]|nr:50S ribosomal protein L32e [Nitrososphaeria archaeon]
MSEASLKKNVEKRRKPDFIRPESWRYVRIKPNWRRPKGIDHKVRKEYKGWPARVKVGYGSPKETRGLHPSGFKEVIIHNVQELLKLDPKTEAAKIAHTVGTKKRIEIFEKAKELGIHVLNPVRLKRNES